MGFYDSPEWRELRYRKLRNSNGRCALCGRTAEESKTFLHVDHIKPRSNHPTLELDYWNLQILCRDCNFGKSNKYEDNWIGTPTVEEFVAYFFDYGPEDSPSRPPRATIKPREKVVYAKPVPTMRPAHTVKPIPEIRVDRASATQPRKRRVWRQLWLLFKLGFITFTGVLVWLSLQLP